MAGGAPWTMPCSEIFTPVFLDLILSCLSCFYAILQVVPHITDALQDWIVDVSKKPVDHSDQEV